MAEQEGPAALQTLLNTLAPQDRLIWTAVQSLMQVSMASGKKTTRKSASAVNPEMLSALISSFQRPQPAPVRPPPQLRLGKSKRLRRESQLVPNGEVPAIDWTLEEYYREVFFPKRASRVGAGTWRREQGYWKRILRYLGHVRLSDLNGALWDDYLDTIQSGNYRRLNQAAYRSLLKSALHRGVISQIHPFEPIKGSGTTKLEVTPFSIDEVKLLLQSAPTRMHRALFAVCIGQGFVSKQKKHFCFIHLFLFFFHDSHFIYFVDSC